MLGFWLGYLLNEPRDDRFFRSTFLMEGLREQMVLGGEKKYSPTQT